MGILPSHGTSTNTLDFGTLSYYIGEVRFRTGSPCSGKGALRPCAGRSEIADGIQEGSTDVNHISKELKRFNLLMSETNAAYHDASFRLGIPDSAMQILYAILSNDGRESCPLQEICRQTGLSKQTINSALRRLERDGMLYLTHTGAKTKDVCLTDKGKALAERTAARLIALEDRIFAAWPAQDVERYLALTERYLKEFLNSIEDLAAE